MSRSFVRFLLAMGLLFSSSLLLVASLSGYKVAQGSSRALRRHGHCRRKWSGRLNRTFREVKRNSTICFCISGMAMAAALVTIVLNALLVFKPSLFKKVFRKLRSFSGNRQVQLSDPASAYVIDGRVFVAVDGFASTPEPAQVDDTRPKFLNFFFTSTRPLFGLALLHVTLATSLITYSADSHHRAGQVRNIYHRHHCLPRHAVHAYSRFGKRMLSFRHIGAALFLMSLVAFCIIPGVFSGFRQFAIVQWCLGSLRSIREYAARGDDEEVTLLNDMDENVELNGPVPAIIRDGKVFTQDQVQVATFTSPSPETTEASAVAHETGAS